MNKDALLRQAEEKQKAMEKTNETTVSQMHAGPDASAEDKERKHHEAQLRDQQEAEARSAADKAERARLAAEQAKIKAMNQARNEQQLSLIHI